MDDEDEVIDVARLNAVIRDTQLEMYQQAADGRPVPALACSCAEARSVVALYNQLDIDGRVMLMELTTRDAVEVATRTLRN